MSQNGSDPADRTPSLTVITLLGVVSGLPFLLTGSTLTTRLRSEGVDLSTIGFFAWAQLPYSIKILWAPFLDRYRLPWLGRRRGWMLLWQLVLVAGIAMMATADPHAHLTALFGLSVGVAFASASLDVVIDAYRTDVLDEKSRGPGGALYITGYRAALVVTGAGALVLADFVEWRVVYALLAAVMLSTVLVTLWARPAARIEGAPRTIIEAIVEPFRDFRARDRALMVLLFVLLYKLGEGMAGHLIQPFLVDVGFSKSAIGGINKGVGLPAAIAGTLLGGVAIKRYGVRRGLLVFGLLQAAPNMLYALQYTAGADHLLLAAVVSVDQFCSGMATAALVVYLMTLCDRRFTAFQYAVLSSAAALLGRIFSGWSGMLAENAGWPVFFIITAAASLPALIVLLFIPERAGYPEAEKAV